MGAYKIDTSSFQMITIVIMMKKMGDREEEEEMEKKKRLSTETVKYLNL
jgi:hypothetical protein